MRRGKLFRYRDPSGVRGTGVVALLVGFRPDGDANQRVVVRRLGHNPHSAFWPGIGDLLEIHGHLGASEIRWLDPDTFDPEADPALSDTGHTLCRQARPACEPHLRVGHALPIRAACPA